MCSWSCDDVTKPERPQLHEPTSHRHPVGPGELSAHVPMDEGRLADVSVTNDQYFQEVLRHRCSTTGHKPQHAEFKVHVSALIYEAHLTHL